jgi:hypothetical protein
MKNNFLVWKFKRVLLFSFFIGSLIGTADVLSVNALGQLTEGGYYCSVPTVIVGGNTCSASGCRDASQIPGEPVMVCDYSGENCPPLESCSQSGGDS